MSIDIPPEMPPVLMHVSKSNDLRREHQTPFYIGKIGDKYVEILDLPYLTREQIERLTLASKNPSQLIVNLAKVYRLNGNLLVQILYRQQANTIFIYGVQTKLVDIIAHPIVRNHFKNIIGDPDLTLGEFEHSRVMADIGAQRRGVNYSVSYALSPDYNETTLVFKPTRKEADRFQSSFDVGNQGNRFAGRDFAGLGMRYRSKWGTEFKMNYLKALSGKAIEDTDTSFDGLVLAVDHPFTTGLYGFQAAVTKYTSASTQEAFRFELPQICDLNPALPLCQLGTDYTVRSDLEANTAVASITAEHILASGGGRRWILNERLRMVGDEISDRSHDAPIVDEHYATAAIGLKYLYGGRGRHGLSEGHYGLQINSGFGNDSGSFGEDEGAPTNEELEVHPSKRSPNFIQVTPNFDLKFGLFPYFIVGAFTEAVLSNGKQVPQQEQYVLGGMDKLSAYLPGVLIGDSGYLSRLTFTGNSRKPEPFQIIPSLFVEHGEVWFEDAEGEAGIGRSISDAGLRLQFFFGETSDLELVVARPLSSSNVPTDLLEASEVDFFARLKIRI